MEQLEFILELTAILLELLIQLLKKINSVEDIYYSQIHLVITLVV
jgi:hypothetical protein